MMTTLVIMTILLAIAIFIAFLAIVYVYNCQKTLCELIEQRFDMFEIVMNRLNSRLEELEEKAGE